MEQTVVVLMIGGRLLLEDVMDGDTGSFLSQHGMTFSNNDTSISGKLTVSGIDGNLLNWW